MPITLSLFSETMTKEHPNFYPEAVVLHQNMKLRVQVTNTIALHWLCTKKGRPLMLKNTLLLFNEKRGSDMKTHITRKKEHLVIILQYKRQM